MHPATSALIVIDVQNDFCPGGALAVTGGDEVVGTINAMMNDFSCIVLTQDWHPQDHTSFAATQGADPFSTAMMPYGAQTLWPTHCVQGTEGAALHHNLRTKPAQLILRKGFRPAIDSYSAFFENDRTTVTGLDGYLRARGMTEVVLAGLATDYCVGFTALDAARLGYGVTVRLDACRAIDLEGSLAQMLEQMRAAGVRLGD